MAVCAYQVLPVDEGTQIEEFERKVEAYSEELPASDFRTAFDRGCALDREAKTIDESLFRRLRSPEASSDIEEYETLMRQRSLLHQVKGRMYDAMDRERKRLPGLFYLHVCVEEGWSADDVLRAQGQ